MRDRILVLTTFLMAVAIAANQLTDFKPTPSLIWFLNGAITIVVIIVVGLIVRNVNKRFQRLRMDIVELQDEFASLRSQLRRSKPLETAEEVLSKYEPLPDINGSKSKLRIEILKAMEEYRNQ